MSAVTIVEGYPINKVSDISIKPYLEPNKRNMGLEKYGLVVFDGVFHEEQLACLEINGTKRYITGLNEFAPELKVLPKEEREAKIKEIRRTVSQLEKELASNIVDPDDPEFWNHVKLLRPDNSDFWDKISIRAGNEPVPLDLKDPYDVIKYHAILAGGFSMIAPSYEEARKRNVAPKFYLDKIEETAAVKIEVNILRNRAKSQLQKLYDKNQNKLFYLAKVLDPLSVQYKKSTPIEIIYENLDKFIEGQLSEKSVRKASQAFIDAANQDIETLQIRALIKDATYYKFLAVKADGYIYHMESNSMLGRTPSDVLEYLKNPLNEQILTDLMNKVDKFWKA